jgi:hypothetical protein
MATTMGHILTLDSMGTTLSIFLSDTSEAVGAKLGHNIPLVDNLKIFTQQVHPPSKMVATVGHSLT